MRTEDCASKIEYVTHSKWTPDQWRAVCSLLRLYRHQALNAILDRARQEGDHSEGGAGGRHG